MAIFLSDVMKNGGLPARGIKDGEANRIAARVRIPAGTVLTDGDFIKIARLAPNVTVRSMLVRWDDLDGGSTLDMDIGWVRAVEDPALAYNASTNPEVVNGAITDGSETADPDYFLNGGTVWTAAGVSRLELGQSGLANEFTVNDVRGLDGHADIALEVIASATSTFSASVDAYLDVELEVISPRTALSDSYDYEAAYD